MENIMKFLIYALMILHVIIGSVFIICSVKKGKGRTKLYIIWELNVLIALIFFIISIQNIHAAVTKKGYTILCIGEIMILIGGYFLYREPFISKKQCEISEIYDKNIETYDLGKEYEEVTKYKEKLGYMRHELVKYISVFEAGAIEDEKINKKLDDLKRQLQSVTEIRYCKNKIVDVIIEKKILDIIQREIKVEMDIKLMNVSESLLKEVCMIIWLLIENVACRLHGEDEMYIKFSEKKTRNREVYISYYIEADKNNVHLSVIKRSREMKLLNEFMNKTNGSIVLLKKQGKVIETGFFIGGEIETE